MQLDQHPDTNPIDSTQKGALENLIMFLKKILSPSTWKENHKSLITSYKNRFLTIDTPQAQGPFIFREGATEIHILSFSIVSMPNASFKNYFIGKSLTLSQLFWNQKIMPSTERNPGSNMTKFIVFHSKSPFFIQYENEKKSIFRTPNKSTK